MRTGPSAGQRLQPPVERRSADGTRPFSVALVGLTGALWAASIGLVVVGVCVLVAWATTPESAGSAADALRAAVQVWLVAHGTSLALPDGGTVGLTPVGLTVGAGLLLWRAGRNIGRFAALDPRQVPEATLSLAVPYAGLAALLATPATSHGVRPDPWHALFGALVLACVAAGGGMARELGASGLLLAGRPRLAAQLYGAAAAVTVLAGGSAVLVAGTLVAHVGQAAVLWRAIGPGLFGGFFLLMACLALVPNAVVWGIAFLLGPGFSLGTGTRVSPFGVELGPLPAFPLLAGAPAALPTAALGLLALPVAAGLVGGLLVERRSPSESTRAAARAGAAVGGLAGLAVALLCWLAAGPVGPGRMETVGASPLLCGLAAVVEVGAAAAVTAAGCVRWRLR